MSGKSEPGVQEVLEALKRALEDDRLQDLPADELSGHLVRGGYLQEEPTVSQAADALASLKAEEQAFGPDVPTEDP